MMKIYQINPVCPINADDDLEKFFTAGWAYEFSIKILKYYPLIIIENHFLHPNIKKKIIINKNGINNVLHPTLKGKLHYNDVDVFSVSLYRDIQQFDQAGVIINHRPFTFMSMYCNHLFNSRPYVVQTHGEGIPSLAKKYLGKNIRNSILSILEKYSMSKIDFYLAGSVIERDYIRKCYPHINVELFKGGICFNEFVKSDTAPSSSEIKILYIGKFYRAKGVDLLIEAVKELKQIYPIKLICIGGEKSDELYDIVLENADIISTRTNKEKVCAMLNIADIYVLPTPQGGKVMNLGGIGTAPIEAMAYNVPVVSNNLIHFPNPSQIPNIGSMGIPNYTIAIRSIIEHRHAYKNIREIAKNLFDDEIVISNLINYCKIAHEKYV